MGGQNSTPEEGAVVLEDQFETDQFIPPQLKEAFYTQAERLPNGELGIKASKLK